MNLIRVATTVIWVLVWVLTIKVCQFVDGWTHALLQLFHSCGKRNRKDALWVTKAISPQPDHLCSVFISIVAAASRYRGQGRMLLQSTLTCLKALSTWGRTSGGRRGQKRSSSSSTSSNVSFVKKYQKIRAALSWNGLKPISRKAKQKPACHCRYRGFYEANQLKVELKHSNA